MISISKIQKLIEKHIDDAPRGISSCFIPINDEWGMKLYRDEYEMNRFYENHLKCLSVDLAPEIGFKFSLNKRVINYKCGYFSEKVEVLRHLSDEEYNNVELYNKWKKDRDKWIEEMKAQKEKIDSKLQKVKGFDFIDWGYYNVGRKNGQFMPVDFGC